VSPGMGVVRYGRRQVWASLESGVDVVIPQYPRVGKTVEGTTRLEATVRTRRPRAPVPQYSDKGKRKVASRPYPQYQ